MTRERLRQFLSSTTRPSINADWGRTSFDSGHRTWNFTRGEKIAGVEIIVWSRTIADVRLDSAELYCADVLMWGLSILADSEDLIRITAGSD